MYQLKWACNLRVQHGVHPRPPARTIHIPVQAVGKRVHGVVGEVTNGVDEDRELVPVRTRAGILRVPAGTRVVRGVVHPPGTSRVL